MNHQEKDDLIAKLKTEIRDLKEKSKVAMGMEKEMKSPAMSVVFADGEYQLVELMFDFESGKGKVVKCTKLGTAWHVMAYRAKECLIKKIVDKVDRK